MRAISSFELYANVPHSGSATFEQIASKTNPPLAVGFVKTILRYAMTQGIFCEPTPGHVAHTASSLLLLKEPLARAFVANNADEVFPAAAKTADAMRKWPSAEAPNHTGLQLAYGTDKGMFEWYASDESEASGRMAKFAGSMQFWSAGEGFLPKHVVNGFDWGSLPENGLVVDVGGGPGHISIAIAEANPSLRLVVQDLPGQSEQALAEAQVNQSSLISSGRLDFKPANFFAPQPEWLEAESVDAYFLRYIFHDWNDAHCVKILQTLLTSGKLKKGGRIVLAESVIPPPEVAPHLPKTVLKSIRRLDMQMLTVLGSHERTLDDWQELFFKADPKLKIEEVNQPEGSVCTMLAARLQS
ncbi:S-adenosyl-L-methionine-dependent methyltransferase [Lophium mytilinum]|uniref:S-adenosyl-L-methionine-dependent methyltransferase n=1 Tax=Lophium mytilinum TaxID=390894 RepID=A0A6A6RAL3_9PEZI|nr:S-adenosyl-L-methionine-dependent methyltransferase [Lophium mytilinum]